MSNDPVAPGTDPSSVTTAAHGGGGPSQAAQFSVGTLQRGDLDADPFTQFHTWFTHPTLAPAAPETCTLSTAALPSGRVSARTVYLKELDPRGFVVYSNFDTSRKARDLQSNPWAALTFWWKPLERQVRVEGRAERLSPDESQVYFDTRARGSRVGAWASAQSSVLAPRPTEEAPHEDGRAELEERVRGIQERFDGQDKIPVPPFWGGLRIVPESIEFWQGRESRLHDRFLYTKVAEGENEWRVERLSP